MDIIQFSEDGYVYDEGYNEFPCFRTKGCSCCAQSLLATQENIDKAKAQAREWLSFLETLQPVNYPEDVLKDFKEKL